MENFDYIRRNYESLCEEIKNLSDKLGTPSPTLVSVTKSGSDEELIALAALGALDIGENRPGEVKRRGEILRDLGYPVFVKPARAGSSVGVAKVKTAEKFSEALFAALREDSKVLIEESISGPEIEVAVLEEDGRYTVAHPAEIDKGSAEFYDYETKYISDASSYYLPARLPEDKMREVMWYAEVIFKALDCRAFSRVDFFYTPEGEFVFNEINTLPGFTPISMYPKMMINEGIPYEKILERLIETAK